MAGTQLAGSQKALRVICIIMMILAVIVAALGALMVFGGGLTGQTIVQGQAMDAAAAANMVGIGLIVGAVIDFFIALLGAHGAKRPGKLGLFKIICIIGAVLSIVGVISVVLQGQYNSVFSNAVMALLQVICAGLAIKISNHAVYAA